MHSKRLQAQREKSFNKPFHLAFHWRAKEIATIEMRASSSSLS